MYKRFKENILLQDEVKIVPLRTLLLDAMYSFLQRYSGNVLTVNADENLELVMKMRF